MPFPRLLGGLRGSGGDTGLPILPPPSNPFYIQPDTFPEQDNVDASNGLAVDYFVRTNAPGILTARLSFKLRAYRTYSTFGNMATAPETQDHIHLLNNDNTASSGHSHGHTHGAHGHGFTMFANAGSAPPAAPNAWTDTVNALLKDNNLAGNVNVNNVVSATPALDSTGESGHNHNHSHGGGTAGRNATHTHPVSGTTTTGVVLGGVAAGVKILFDGVDQTAALGGPWSGDIIEMDVLKYIWAVKDGLMHTITLTPSGLGRINAVLRISYAQGGLQNF